MAIKRKLPRKAVKKALRKPRAKKVGSNFQNSANFMQMPPDVVHIIMVLQSPEFQKYKVLSYLGGGEFGAVFLVQDKTNKKKYALKVSLCHQKDKQCLTEECRVQKAFANAGLAPKVLKCGYVKHEQLGITYVLMDVIKGVPLFEWITEKVRTRKEVERLFMLLVKVWKKMQMKKLGHEDAHVANIMLVLTATGGLKDVKLIDFGHARTDGFNLALMIEKLLESLRRMEHSNLETVSLIREMLYDLIDQMFTGGMKQFGKQLISGKVRHRKDFKIWAA